MDSGVTTLRQLSVDDYVQMILVLPVNDLIHLCQIAPVLNTLAMNKDFWAAQVHKNFEFPPELFVKSHLEDPINLYIEIGNAAAKDTYSHRFEQSLDAEIERGEIEFIRYWVSTENHRRYVESALNHLMWKTAAVGNLDILKLLLEFSKTLKYPINESIEKAIESASANGRGVIVRYLDDLVGGRYDQETLDKSLVAAAGSGDLELVKYWLEKGAKSFDEALKEATLSERVDVIHHLIELKKADLNAVLKDLSRYKWVKLPMVQEIITAGATNLDECVVIAAKSVRFDIVNALVAAGARSTQQTYPCDHRYYYTDNEEPLVKVVLQAYENSQFDMIKFVADSGAKQIDEIITKAAQVNRLDVVQFLLANGALNDQRFFDKVGIINQGIITANSSGQTNVPMMTCLLQPITGESQFTEQQLQGYYTLSKYMVEKNEKTFYYALKSAIRDNRMDIIELVVQLLWMWILCVVLHGMLIEQTNEKWPLIFAVQPEAKLNETICCLILRHNNYISNVIHKNVISVYVTFLFIV